MNLGDENIIRHLDSAVRDGMSWSPVVVVAGPRACGKSTLMRSLAKERSVPIIDLDDPEVLAALSDDVTGYLSSAQRPVCIDEFQHDLTILSAIKAELNKGMSPGRYLLTGSTRYTMLPRASQSLTGRAHIVNLWPFSQGELRGVRENFLDTLFAEPENLPIGGVGTTTRLEYEQIVLSGGFPIALGLPRGHRDKWFQDYINLVVRRDLLALRQVRERRAVADVLRHVMAQTGQVLRTSRIANEVGHGAHLVGDLIELLEAVFLIHRLEAYGRTLSARVTKSPKVHAVDTGLAASLLKVTGHKLRALDPATVTEFGHLVESFAVNELIKQSGWSQTRVDFSHFRTHDQQEVDLVVEADDGRVVAVEVKAGTRITDVDFRGMALLRDRLGESFTAGVLLNLGTQAYRRPDGFHVLPLDTLWTNQ